MILGSRRNEASLMRLVVGEEPPWSQASIREPNPILLPILG